MLLPVHPRLPNFQQFDGPNVGKSDEKYRFDGHPTVTHGSAPKLRNTRLVTEISSCGSSSWTRVHFLCA